MNNLKRALLDGALVVLPIGAIVLLVLGIVHKLQQAVDPLAGRLVHPAVVAVAALVLLSSAEGRPMRPALATLEDGLSPVLVMDDFADGRLLVFVPSSPAPMSGAVYIFTPDRVTLLDVPLMSFMKALSSWGLGLPERHPHPVLMSGPRISLASPPTH